MEKGAFNEVTSLVIVANDFPDKYFREMLKNAHTGEYFEEIYMRWTDLFDILPEAKNVKWHEAIEISNPDMFYDTMRMVVESDATPIDLYADILAATEGLTMRWETFLTKVPSAKNIDWFKIAEKFHSDSDPE